MPPAPESTGDAIQADLYDATWLQHPWGENVLKNIADRELDVMKAVPVRGAIEPFPKMVQTIRDKGPGPAIN